MYCKKKFRPKLGAYPVTVLIYIFGCHFSIDTHVTSKQAELYIKQFQKSFAYINDLILLDFCNSTLEQITEKVRDTKSRPNLAIVLLNANVAIQNLHTIFDSTKSYIMQQVSAQQHLLILHTLSLPQYHHLDDPHLMYINTFL